MKINVKCEIPIGKTGNLLTISTTDIGNIYICLNADGHESGVIVDMYDLEEAVTKCCEAIVRNGGREAIVRSGG